MSASKFIQLVASLSELMAKKDNKTTAWTMAKLWAGISSKRQEAIYDQVTEEVRETLTESIGTTLREQIEQEMREKWQAQALKSARKEAKEELAAQAPTKREREAFQLFVQETEIDVQAQAAVASASADRLTRTLTWARRVRGFLAGGLFLGLGPALYAVYHWVGTLMAPELAGAAVALLATLLLMLRSNRKRYAWLEAEIKRLYKTASDYLILAERSKSFRIVHAERLETKARIDDLTAQLREHKNELDEKYHPSVAELDVAREAARHRIMADNSMQMRIDDFDDRLREAQEEAAVEEAAAVEMGSVGR